MPLHIRKEVAKHAVPIEFIRLAFAHLESSDKLNSLMNDGSWSCSFYKGQVVHWLAFHATELFLKGCILQISPRSSINDHSLARLGRKLKTLRPDIDFHVPFRVEALPPYPELVAKAEKLEKKIHERLRYPTDTAGDPWSGVHGFDSELFSRTLQKLRADLERVANELFFDSPANTTLQRTPTSGRP
jgi:hypothetical protein